MHSDFSRMRLSRAEAGMLCRQARDGCERSHSVLVRQILYMMFDCTAKMGVTMDDAHGLEERIQWIVDNYDDARGSLSSLTYRTVKNHVRNLWTKQKRYEERKDMWRGEHRTCLQPDIYVLEECEHKESMYARMWRHMLELPDDWAQWVIRHKMYGVTLKTIADEEGCTINNIFLQIQRALAFLKQKMLATLNE